MVSSQPNIHRDYREDLEAQLLEKHTHEKDLLILDKCVPFSNLTVRCRGSEMYPYPQVLGVSVTFTIFKLLSRIYLRP